MKKRIMSFVLAAMLGAFCYMPILDVRAKPEAVGRGTLRYEAEDIQRDFVGNSRNYAQSDPTLDFPGDWRTYSVGEPIREYEA